MKCDYESNGLFYVADTHFENVLKIREIDSVATESGPARNQEIYLDTLPAYLYKKFADGKHADKINLRADRGTLLKDIIYRRS